MWNLIHFGLWRGQGHQSERNQSQLYFKFIWRKFHRHKRQLSNNCCTQATEASQDLKNGFKPPQKSWAFCKGINIWREKFTYLWKHPRKKLDQLSVALISFKKCERSQEQNWENHNLWGFRPHLYFLWIFLYLLIKVQFFIQGLLIWMEIKTPTFDLSFCLA